MALFGRGASTAHEWSGRSTELPDAGAVPWTVLWDAIAAPRPPDGTGAMVAVGLDGIHVGYKNDPTSIYHGHRHGRWVQIRQVRIGRGLSMVVWVGAAAPSFTIVGDGARLVSRDAPPPVESLLTGLVANRVWNGLECAAGQTGVITRRRVGSRFPQGWMYDLWLAETLAAATGARPLASPPGDPVGWRLSAGPLTT